MIRNSTDGSTRPVEHWPLSGIRVLEFAQIAAGPFAGSLLADLGADVVKIEPPGGDGMRTWPPLVGTPEDRFSGNFASLNRNKRSVVADLRDPETLHEVKSMVAKVDVIVENNRPGVMERLGLGYDIARALNPQVIYASISGYGQRGPYRERAAFDVAIQAITGLMSVTGEADGPPVKCGVPVADFVAGLYAAVCVLAALRQRSETGIGSYIDCPMMTAMLGISALQMSEYVGTGRPPARLGTAHPRNAPYQVFPTADRDIVVVAGNQKMWSALCKALGVPQLTYDERFLDQERRATNQSELAALLAPVFSRRSAEHWIKVLDAVGIATAVINDFGQALSDPQLSELDLLQEVRLPNGSNQLMLEFPVLMSTLEANIYAPPPLLGEHNDEVLRQWLGTERSARSARSDSDRET